MTWITWSQALSTSCQAPAPTPASSHGAAAAADGEPVATLLDQAVDQFHRVLDQLEASTEALIIDVEQTLRRLRDRGA